MDNIFSKALKKIVEALDSEKIDYMIVGGFAVSYHNRARTTNDIDLILQIHSHHVGKILKYFPEWLAFEESFKSDVKTGMLFNITDFDTGIRYDFMTFQDTDYNWSAFERRKKVNFWGISCYLSSPEDLIISKLRWHNISPSDKQMDDLHFLLLDQTLDMEYVRLWVTKLKLQTYGLLG
ncbi:MAG: nucleotidyltransferase [Bacteroidia bacterium]|nr:nucleotidyltransferase [Bacteroidia bacterium]